MTQLDQSALRARNTLITLFLLLCILDVVLISLVQDRWAIGRLVFTIGVMYCVIQGQKWAKWLLVGICSLLVVLLVAMIVALNAKLSIVVIVGSVVMAVLSTIIAIYLITNSDINRYFSYKRQASFP